MDTGVFYTYVRLFLCKTILHNPQRFVKILNDHYIFKVYSTIFIYVATVNIVLIPYSIEGFAYTLYQPCL